MGNGEGGMGAKRPNRENRGNIMAEVVVASAAIAIIIIIIVKSFSLVIININIQGVSRHGLLNHPHFV